MGYKYAIFFEIDGSFADKYGNNCSYLGSPYINNCDFDGAGAMLQHIYSSSLAPPSAQPSGQLITFSQVELRFSFLGEGEGEGAGGARLVAC